MQLGTKAQLKPVVDAFVLIHLNSVQRSLLSICLILVNYIGVQTAVFGWFHSYRV
jgi:hypothetical protein